MTSIKFRDEAGEQVRRFFDGSVAYSAVAAMVYRLLRRGHLISVNDTGDVSIVPGIHEAALIGLTSNWHGTRAAVRAWHARQSVNRELHKLFTHGVED